MDMERPDLSEVSAAVRAYIEALETELEKYQRRRTRQTAAATPEEEIPLEPSEPPTTINVITISGSGMAKRSPRHLYDRQRRGGMGVFDLETSEEAWPTILTVADESQHLVVVTNQARAFRLPVQDIPATELRAKGTSLEKWLSLRAGEQMAVAFPDLEQGYLLLLTDRGHVRRLRYHYLGSKLRPGTNLYNLSDLGAPVAACWSDGDRELFITSRDGRAIRFAERLVPANGCLGIRLGRNDTAVDITTVEEDSHVFLMSADGKGTVRLMSGFSANKSAGSGGKIAMKTDQLVGAVVVDEADDIFAISRLSKIIRFQVAEVPPKEGVVQGVNCMALRADETLTITKSSLPKI